MRRKTNQDFVRQVKNLVGNEYSLDVNKVLEQVL